MPNIKRISRRFFIKTLSLTALSAIITSSVIRRTSADVPDVLQIENISQELQSKIRLQIRHANPNNNHYVDIIEVDIGGQIKSFNLQPQSSNPFTEDFELNDIQGTPEIKARAHCNLHGWSSWSNQIVIPEFSTGIFFALTSFIAALAILGRTKKN
ncbi:hypothetical protein [[Eubacterium] cellulosolvens]